MKKFLTLFACVAIVVSIVSCSKSEKKYLTVSPGNVTVSSAETDVSISVSSNTSYTSSIVEGAAWITKMTSSSSTTEVYHISAGITDGGRTGKIVFVGGGISDTVKITQSQKDLVELSTGATTLDYKGGTYIVVLRSNLSGYDLSILNTPSWLRFSSTKSVSTTRLDLIIDENLSGADRDASIVCKDKNSALSDTLSLQQQTVPFLKLSTAGIYDGETAKIQYTQYSDQYSMMTSATNYAFRLQNVFSDSFCSFEGIPLDLSNTTSFTLTVAQNYVTGTLAGTYTVQILKSENGNVWLYNSDSGLGFIIKK
ncbi:MAG: BACON domain-containing carbohydrate-binding protein [Bacteroidales bacterium]